MKKILAIILVLGLILSSCNQPKANYDTKNDPRPQRKGRTKIDFALLLVLILLVWQRVKCHIKIYDICHCTTPRMSYMIGVD